MMKRIHCACGKFIDVDAKSVEDVRDTLKQLGWALLKGTRTCGLCRTCAAAANQVAKAHEQFSTPKQ